MHIGEQLLKENYTQGVLNIYNVEGPKCLNQMI